MRWAGREPAGAEGVPPTREGEASGAEVGTFAGEGETSRGGGFRRGGGGRRVARTGAAREARNVLTSDARGGYQGSGRDVSARRHRSVE